MKPLEGFRILDFTQFLSGPTCTLLLGDYGAEVIKIEKPPYGDTTRHGKVMKNGKSSHYATRNRGKKSILLDMKNEKHKKLFLELVKTADAVVENFKPGNMEKFGITYELLEEINPRIVYTRISGYGQKGPYADRSAYDTTVQAESGVMYLTGQPGDPPTICGASIGDYCGGLCGCIGTLMGLLDAQRTGHGREIDVSMMEALLLLQENRLSTFLEDGVIPHPAGNRYPVASPIRDFRCKDGKSIMINISTDAQFHIFAELFGHEEWLENPHFATMTTRAEHFREMESEVEKVFAEYTRDKIVEKMQSRKLVYGNINDYEDVRNHPQVRYRHSLADVVYPDGTTFRIPGDPFLMSRMERNTQFHAADLGEDTIDILSEVADPAYVHELMDPVLQNAENPAEDKDAYSG